MKKKAIGKSDYRKSGTVLKTTDNRKGYHAGGSTSRAEIIRIPGNTPSMRSQRTNAQNQMAKAMQGPNAPVFEKPSGSISRVRSRPRPRVGPGRVRRRPISRPRRTLRGSLGRPTSRPRRTLRGSLGRPTRSVRRGPSPMRPRSAPSFRRRSVGSTLRSRRPSFRPLRRR